MAGYRPKSLNELNNLYDKSRNAKNEIDKKASVLAVPDEAEAVVIPTNEATPEIAPEATVPQASAGDISGLVDDFILNFGNSAPAKAVRPSTVAPTPIKAVSSPKASEPKADRIQSVHPAQAAATDRPKLIRNSERNELFEDYKKVMDDEDDYESSRNKWGKKRGRRFFEKKSADEAAQIEETASEPEVVIPVEEAYPVAELPAEPEIPETLENINAVIDMVLGVSPAQQQNSASEEEQVAEEIAAQEAPEENPIPDEPQSEELSEPQEEQLPVETPVYEPLPEEDAPEEEIISEDDSSLPEEDEAEAESSTEAYFDEPVKKKYAGKNVLLVVLFLVLLLGTAISAVKAFSGVNTDNLVLGKYRVFSATINYEEAQVEKGDLVIVTHESIREGDIFAHKTGDGEYALAKLDSVLNEENVVADNDGQKSIVLKNNLRGVIYKTYPAIGSVAAFIVSSYLYIMGILLAVAAILLVVILVVFGKKSSATELEEAEDASDEAAPEYEEDEEDFRYLIQDDDSDDDYSSYSTEDGEEDAGLPV